MNTWTILSYLSAFIMIASWIFYSIKKDPNKKLKENLKKFDSKKDKTTDKN